MKMTKILETKTSQIALLGLVGVAAVAVALAPMAKAEETETEVTANVGSVISLLTSNGTVNLGLTPTPTGVQSTASDTVTVSTNNPAGYNLTLKTSTAQTALEAGSNSIPAISGTQASPVALTANTWGYRVDGLGGFGAGPTSAGTSTAIGARTYAGVPTTANTLKTTASTATNDTTTVWYSAAVNTSTPTGAYKNDVTYTALTN